MRDRRDEPRHPSGEHVEVCWSDDAGVDQSCTGVLQDFSRSGARIRFDRPVRTKTKVRLTIGAKVLRGAVRSCVRLQSGYMLGIEFDPEYQGILKASN